MLADGPFSDVSQVIEHPLLIGRVTPEIALQLDVSSRWYLAQARVVLEGIERDFFRLMALDGTGYDFRYVSQGVP